MSAAETGWNSPSTASRNSNAGKYREHGICRQNNTLTRPRVGYLADPGRGPGQLCVGRGGGRRPAARQFPDAVGEGRSQEPHLPDRPQRRGQGEQGEGRRRSADCRGRRTADSAATDRPAGGAGGGAAADHPADPVRGRTPAGRRQACGPRGPRRQRHRLRADRATARSSIPNSRSSSSPIGSIAKPPGCCCSPSHGAPWCACTQPCATARSTSATWCWWRGSGATTASTSSSPCTSSSRLRASGASMSTTRARRRTRSSTGSSAWSRVRAARGGTADRPHAPDSRPPRASRLSDPRRRQVRRLRPQQARGSWRTGRALQPHVPARGAHQLRPSGQRRTRSRSKRAAGEHARICSMACGPQTPMLR